MVTLNEQQGAANPAKKKKKNSEAQDEDLEDKPAGVGRQCGLMKIFQSDHMGSDPGSSPS